MPFTPVNELPPNPAVRIFFSGLMIAQPNEDGSHCEIFVNNKAPNHDFSVETRQRFATGPDIVWMRRFGPLTALPNEPVETGLKLEVVAQPSKLGVKRYEGPKLEGGEDSLTTFAIDLENPKFQGISAADIDVGTGRPSISLNAGTFYSAVKTSLDSGIELIKVQGSQSLGPIQFATVIGANIYLEDNELLRVVWLQNNIPLPRVLELKKSKPEDPPSSYEIRILNDPLFVDPEAIEERHDEFAQYYLMFPTVPDVEKVTLKVPAGTITEERGTPTTLCMTTVKGGGG